MQNLCKRKAGFFAILFALLFVCILSIGSSVIRADETAGIVSVGDIDYDQLTMKIYKNGNGIVYFSSDSKKTWMEAEGESGQDQNGKAYVVMDISWVSSTADTTVYFKGDKDTTALEVEFPKMNSAFKVKFDKVNIDFEFEECDDAVRFIWRKESDYNWKSVPFDNNDAEYKAFLKEIEGLRLKGAKIIIRCDQIIGTSAEDPGQRMSKEVKISIAKMANAPSVKVNIKKMKVSTKATMEYYDSGKNAWVACEKDMPISDIAPEAMYSDGKEGKSVSLKIRTAATEKKAYSKTLILEVPGQGKAPEFGTDVTASIDSEKLTLSFESASSTAPLEYCIVKADETFDPLKVKWKTVKIKKEVKVKEKAAPTGSTVYIRYAGTSENVKKGISLKLPSYYDSYSVTWPKADDKT